jgi:hypothetical protein
MLDQLPFFMTLIQQEVESMISNDWARTIKDTSMLD